MLRLGRGGVILWSQKVVADSYCACRMQTDVKPIPLMVGAVAASIFASQLIIVDLHGLSVGCIVRGSVSIGWYQDTTVVGKG